MPACHSIDYETLLGYMLIGAGVGLLFGTWRAVRKRRKPPDETADA